MAPKGLSLDEKRKRMLDIFYDSKDVFLLKDLEKIAPKQKGITMQSVKVRSTIQINLFGIKFKIRITNFANCHSFLG
jgi:hypothetical protein